LDGLDELEPELELGAVCDWVSGGGCPPPEYVEPDDGPVLDGLVCCAISTGSDVPLVDDVVGLEADPDGDRVRGWMDVCR